MKNKKDLIYGKTNKIKELDVKKSKIRITTMIDYPLYVKLNERAKKKGVGYQTYLNQILKNALDDKYLDLNHTLNELKSVLRGLEIKVKAEKKVS